MTCLIITPSAQCSVREVEFPESDRVRANSPWNFNRCYLRLIGGRWINAGYPSWLRQPHLPRRRIGSGRGFVPWRWCFALDLAGLISAQRWTLVMVRAPVGS